MPKLEQFMLMKCRPLSNQAERSRGELSRKDCEGIYVDSRFVAGVFGVEVGWVVIGKIHPDHDAVEATDFRH